MSDKRALTWFVLIALLCGAALVTVALATGGGDLVASVLSGGGSRIESGNSVLHVTIGEPVAGSQSVAGTEVCVGYAGLWCSDALRYRTYLPLAVKNGS